MKTSEEIAEMVRRVRNFETEYRQAQASCEKLRAAHEAFELAEAVVQAFESNQMSEYRRCRIDLAFALLDRALGPDPIDTAWLASSLPAVEAPPADEESDE